MAKKERTLFTRSEDGSMAYTTDGNFIYAEKDGVVMRLDMFAGHYYKLRPYNGSVILEIDGLRMQLVRDFETPMDYSKEVVKKLGIPQKGSFTVLDTCMGLGYTAMAAAETESVGMVVTCEVSEAVMTLAQWNPFSEPLFRKGSKIVVMRGNALELARGFESAMFSFVIHDPPRLSHAPELYSAAFYAELYRICRKGARIFHYVGSVGKGRGRSIESEVGKRLAEAGFRKVRHDRRLQGLFAEK